jgi:hypothetical protein
MPRPRLSGKHIQIDKANQAVIIATAVAVAVAVFGIFAGRAMLLRQAHQSRVIKEKETAVRILRENIEAKDKIVQSYTLFTSASENILGGSAAANATGPRDGDNARLVLDALPSKYDYPALISSVEKLLIDNGYSIESISGTDDEVNQPKDAQAEPEPVEMPFAAAVNVPFSSAHTLMSLFESSIRPFKVNTLEITAERTTLKIQIDAVSFYQPEKALQITTQVVK